MEVPVDSLVALQKFADSVFVVDEGTKRILDFWLSFGVHIQGLLAHWMNLSVRRGSTNCSRSAFVLMTSSKRMWTAYLYCRSSWDSSSLWSSISVCCWQISSNALDFRCSESAFISTNSLRDRQDSMTWFIYYSIVLICFNELCSCSFPAK
jgi:hypothetical protein